MSKPETILKLESLSCSYIYMFSLERSYCLLIISVLYSTSYLSHRNVLQYTITVILMFVVSSSLSRSLMRIKDVQVGVFVFSDNLMTFYSFNLII